MLLILENIPEYLQQSLTATFQNLFVRNAAHMYQEFVTANTGNNILIAEKLLNFFRCLGQHCISEKMAELIIDLLEIVQIDNQYRAVHAAGKAVKIGLYLPASCIFIQQFCQRIPLCTILKCLFRLFLRINIDNDTGNFLRLPIFVANRCRPNPAPEVTPLCCCNANLHHLIVRSVFNIVDTVKQKRQIVGMQVGTARQLLP